MPFSNFTKQYLKKNYAHFESIMQSSPNAPHFKKPAYILKKMLQGYGLRYKESTPNNEPKSIISWGLDYLGSFFPNYDKEQSQFAAQLAAKINYEDANCNNLTTIFNEANDYLSAHNVSKDSGLAGIWIAFFKLFPFYANALPANSDSKASVLSQYAEFVLLENISLLNFATPTDEPYELMIHDMQEKIIFAMQFILDPNSENYDKIMQRIKLDFSRYHASDYYLKRDKIKSFSSQRQDLQKIITDFNLIDRYQTIINNLINCCIY
ncbi:hypothetical protein B1207_01085 [Legionella quinlivanii]|uniref:Uncharacterized protein n=1 Tax=Legionella quinlivanii TaxID=45073 RepID=A0A364LN86_9GAMM|nr:hypothetical protein [Legionella quinlivanii]RAP38511.1 hypothetical protein B1207_01085 [Legionella quinlivanii]